MKANDETKSLPSDSASSVTDLAPSDSESIPANGFGPNVSGPADQDTPIPRPARTKVQIAMIMLSLSSAMFLASLDVSIVSTMLPTMAADLGSAQGYTWVGSAYTLGYAAGAPAWGKVSDVFGRKPVLLAAVADFLLGSLVCGSAPNMDSLLAGRAVQGLGGGGIVVLVNICMGDLFSPRERGLYLGVMGMVWAVSGGLGPVAGGLLASGASWRWAFYANLPIAGFALAVLVLALDLHNPRTPLRQGLAAIDWLGCATVMGGTVMLLLGLELGGVAHPWSSPTVVGLIISGLVGLGLFAYIERRVARHPMIPHGLLLHRRANLSALGVCFFHGMAALGTSFYLPLYFQSVLAAPPLLSGLYVLPYTVSLGISTVATGLIMRRTGHFLPCIVLGLASMVLGLSLLATLGTSASTFRIVMPQILAGSGAGAIFQPPMLALQAGVAPHDVAAATATFGFVRQLATSASMVLGGVVFQNAMASRHATLEAVLGPDTAALLDGATAAASVGSAASLTGEKADVAKAAYGFALGSMFAMYAALAGAALLVGVFMSQERLSRHHVEVKTGLQALVPARGEGSDGESSEGEKEKGRA